VTSLFIQIVRLTRAESGSDPVVTHGLSAALSATLTCVTGSVSRWSLSNAASGVLRTAVFNGTCRSIPEVRASNAERIPLERLSVCELVDVAIQRKASRPRIDSSMSGWLNAGSGEGLS
jgi:hypothetical protein